MLHSIHSWMPSRVAISDCTCDNVAVGVPNLDIIRCASIDGVKRLFGWALPISCYKLRVSYKLELQVTRYKA